MEWLHPQARTVGGLFFGLAFQGDRAGNDDFVAAEVKAGQARGFHALGQMLIAPEMDAESVRERVREQGFVGLKPYHLMAKTSGPTFLAPIEDYLSEAHVRIAHEEGLSVTLHMVLDRAIADPRNQATIRRYCEAYPNMRMILAHAARGFNPWHTIEGIGSLRGLKNLWCDTSAVTEAGAFEAIVETLGHDRLLYGTDFHVRRHDRLTPVTMKIVRRTGSPTYSGYLHISESVRPITPLLYVKCRGLLDTYSREAA